MQRAAVVFLAVLLGFLLTGAAGAQVVRFSTPTPTPAPSGASVMLSPTAGSTFTSIERDFYVECWKCHFQFPLCRQFAARRRYLQLWNRNGAFKNREQHPYGWAQDLRNPRFTG